jgi:hypothetical protein
VNRRILTLLLAALLVPSVILLAQDATPGPSTERRTETDGRSRTLTLGETVSGQVSSTRVVQRYELAASADSRYTIDLTSEDFDTYLVVYDADGVEVASNDDGGFETDSRISIFSPPADGIYTIEVTSFTAQGGFGEPPEGTFTLTVVESDIATLTLERVVRERLPIGEGVDYLFEGSAGDVVIFTVTSEAFDTVLVVTLDDVQIAFNDDSGATTDSRIGPLTLPEDGTYLVRVEAFFADEAGPYTLSAEAVSVAATVVGEPSTQAVGDTSTLAFTFDGFGGDIVDVATQGAATVAIYDAGGFELAYAEGPDPVLDTVSLPGTGTHTVVVTPASGAEAVTVTVTAGNYQALLDGTNTVALNASGETYVTFSVFADEPVEMTFVPAADDAAWDIAIELQSGDGEYIGYYAGSYGDALSFSFTPFFTGQMIVVITEYTGVQSALEVTLTRPGGRDA